MSASKNPPIICVAPMIDYTDRHMRYFLRLMSKHVRLYSEMITTHAILNGDKNYLLKFNAQEKYVALQLGGCSPTDLSACTKLAEEFGYDEVNLNVGCPSSRVSAGKFGACLMLEPDLTADCVSAMIAATTLPVTIKCRIGVDEKDSKEEFFRFIETIAKTGCQTFIVHARKAWLKGLSPKQNREIPPLQYEVVHELKRIFPELNIIINGGIKSISDIEVQLSMTDGVMLGREVCANPYVLTQIGREYFDDKLISRSEIIASFLAYVESELNQGTKLAILLKPILNLFHGEAGANRWRRYLSENMHQKNSTPDIVINALELVAGHRHCENAE